MFSYGFLCLLTVFVFNDYMFSLAMVGYLLFYFMYIELFKISTCVCVCVCVARLGPGDCSVSGV